MANNLVMGDPRFGCRRGQVWARTLEARVTARGAIQTQFLESTRRTWREHVANSGQTRREHGPKAGQNRREFGPKSRRIRGKCRLLSAGAESATICKHQQSRAPLVGASGCSGLIRALQIDW